MKKAERTTRAAVRLRSQMSQIRLIWTIPTTSIVSSRSTKPCWMGRATARITPPARSLPAKNLIQRCSVRTRVEIWKIPGVASSSKQSKCWQAEATSKMRRPAKIQTKSWSMLASTHRQLPFSTMLKKKSSLKKYDLPLRSSRTARVSVVSTRGARVKLIWSRTSIMST